jgi:hypothetical protein
MERGLGGNRFNGFRKCGTTQVSANFAAAEIPVMEGYRFNRNFPLYQINEMGVLELELIGKYTLKLPLTEKILKVPM